VKVPANCFVRVSDVTAGDKRAMRLLYTRHSMKVFRFISRIVNNPSLAEDLVSEVMVLLTSDDWRGWAA
jgi:RNA polymerase sigma-70 factor, ECF subfamily